MNLSDPRTIIVIPTFNSAEDIEECLNSIIALKLNSARIVVIDNNSIDNTIEIVRRNYPQVFVIQNSYNCGYAVGCNIGFESFDSDYVVFVNADTSTNTNWIHDGISRMEETFSIGASQPKILLYSDRNKINSSGNMANFLFFGWANGYGEPDSSDREIRKIAFASGAATIYRTSYLKRIGCFDESFFMYCEDTDLGIRLFLAGYDTIYCPDGIIYHKYRYKESGWKYQLLERNRLMILLKTYRKKTLLALLPIIAVSELGVILKARSEGWLTYKIISYGGVIKRLPILLKNRKNLQTIRVRSDSELFSLLKGAITFSPLDSFISKKGNELLDKYREFLIHLRI
jgi:hypothetical protein